MADELCCHDDNCTIHQRGKCTFNKGHYCTTNTVNGSISIFEITNPGQDNTLVIMVSGAPATMYTTDGKLFNGEHQVPPNSPAANITALGDFEGKKVTIYNASPLDTPCKLEVRT